MKTQEQFQVRRRDRRIHTPDGNLDVAIDRIEMDSDDMRFKLLVYPTTPGCFPGTDATAATLFTEDGKNLKGCCWHLQNGEILYENWEDRSPMHWDAAGVLPSETAYYFV